MSQWTHICGCIRIDFMQAHMSDETLIRLIKDKFGKTAQFESSEEEWVECDVPTGSEGSVQYEVALTGNQSSLARVVVYIWADLRFFGEDDVNELINWVKNSTDKLFVRQGVVTIGVEYGKKRVMWFDGETNSWKVRTVK